MIDDWTDLMFTICMALFLYFTMGSILTMGINLERARTAEGIREVDNFYLLNQFVKAPVMINGRQMTVAEAIPYAIEDSDNWAVINNKAEELLTPAVQRGYVWTIHIMDEGYEIKMLYAEDFPMAFFKRKVTEGIRLWELMQSLPITLALQEEDPDFLGLKGRLKLTAAEQYIPNVYGKEPAFYAVRMIRWMA